MRYKYLVKEEGSDKNEEIQAMSFHKLIKKLENEY